MIPTSQHSSRSDDPTGRNHEVLRRILLQHEPHGFDVISRMAPITFGIQGAQLHRFLLFQVNLGDASGDFSRHEIVT